jgi:hypothetical protein
MNIKKKFPQDAAREDFNDVEVFLNREDNQFYYLDRYRQPVRLVPESLATDTNNQTLEIGGEFENELVLAGGSLNGAPVPDSAIPISSLKPALGIIAETNIRATFNVVPSEVILNNDIGLKVFGNPGVNVIRGGVGNYSLEWDEGVITNPSALQVIISSSGAAGFAQAYVTIYTTTGVSIKVADLNGSPLDGGIFEIAIKYFG